MSITRRSLMIGAAAVPLVSTIRWAGAQAAEFNYKYANNLPLAHPMNVRAQEAVDHPVHVELVAGNGVARQDHRVALTGLQPLAVAAGEQRQRGHRLSLRSRGDQHHALRWHHLGGTDIEYVRIGYAKVSEFSRDAHVAHHRPPDERHPPAQRDRGVDDLLHPIDIRGEARDQHPSLGAADQPVQRRTDLALRRPHPWNFGIR